MWDPRQVIKPCLSFLPCKMVIMPTLKGHVTNEIMYALHLAQCLVHRGCFVLVSQGVSIFQLENLFLFKLETIAVLRSEARGRSRHCHRGERGHRDALAVWVSHWPGGGCRCAAAARLLSGGSSPRAPLLGLSLQPQSSASPFDLPPRVINKLPGFSKPPALSPVAGREAPHAAR